MTAWCALCGDAQEYNESGCLVCSAIAEKQRRIHADSAKSTRLRLRNSGICINGSWHGPPEAGKTKCTRCLETHRRSNKRRAA